MEFEELPDSGLVVPKQKPEKPPRRFGPTELTDPKKRELASEGLNKLWDAMDLSQGGGIQLEGAASHQLQAMRRQLYMCLAESLLCDEYTLYEREKLC